MGLTNQIAGFFDHYCLFNQWVSANSLYKVMTKRRDKC